MGVGGGGGASFFIRDDIPPKFTHPSIEASGITIHGRRQDVNVFNFSIHTGSMQNQITINVFSKIISNYNNNTILVGHFNSKNVMWGSPMTCSKGEVIEEFMNKNDLICLNDGTSTFLHNSHHFSSWLDLTLVSSGLVASGSGRCWTILAVTICQFLYASMSMDIGRMSLSVNLNGI